MLVLSRKPLESVVIGEDVRITVIQLDRNHVRIGIEAPDNVVILRSELLERSREWDSAPREAGACR